jgi:hypothetical protein
MEGLMRNVSRWGLPGIITLLATSAALGAADLVVYGNGLGSGWQNWSWSTTVNFANSSPVHGGSGTSAAVTYNTAWAGLYLHTDATITTSAYATLQFAIHGGTTGGQRLQVIAYDAALAAGGSVAVSPPAAGAWTSVEIPISAFGVSQISGFVWQDTSGVVQPVFYLDDIVLVGGAPPPPPTLAIDASAGRHAISPYIYGMNFGDPALAADIRLPINRWGGNGTTRYNWQNDTPNHASDWFFENIPDDNSNPGMLPNGSSADRFVEQNLALGTQTIMTVPLIGWTPKARSRACGFSVTKYGPQQQTDPWAPDCGNGIRPDGTLITGNDPQDTSIGIGPSFVQGWIAHLVGRYGTAAAGGVRFYNLDNEPMLWNSTHRDVHPTPVSYDEMRDRTYQYAAAIKATDSASQTLGPVEWGWTGYLYSAADAVGGGDWWNRRPDRMAHGDMPFIEWYLQQMQAYDQAHGLRILDYLDLHCYPQSGVALRDAGDAAMQAKRLRSTRSLWDPTYVDESWIAEPVRMVPRMRDWVASRYPGTKLAITEYNWGGLEHINGALAQADVLGIFGREALDLATLWDPPGSSEPGAFAFRMYRNYDGAGHGFGTTSVTASSNDQDRVAVYASLRDDGALTVMLINKTSDALTTPLAIQHFTPASHAQVYRYSPSDLGHILRDADLALAGTVTIGIPASSIALLVIPREFVAADIDHDGDVDQADFGRLQACLTGATIPQTDPNCQDARLDADDDVDQDDVAGFRRCISGPGQPASQNCVN